MSILISPTTFAVGIKSEGEYDLCKRTVLPADKERVRQSIMPEIPYFYRSPKVRNRELYYKDRFHLLLS